MGKDFRELSRIHWKKADDKPATIEEVQYGCMLRIADATELMAQDRIQMERDLKYYKELSESRGREREILFTKQMPH
jgi:hypothetical protein